MAKDKTVLVFKTFIIALKGHKVVFRVKESHFAHGKGRVIVILEEKIVWKEVCKEVLVIKAENNFWQESIKGQSKGNILAVAANEGIIWY